MAAVLAAACSTGARPLLQQSQLAHLNENRYVVVENLFSRDLIARLQQDALAVDAHVGINSAIGTLQSSTRRLDTSVRKSRQCAILPPPPNHAGSVETRAELIAVVNALRDELQRSSLLALPQLEPFSTELNYLLYPKGGHYMRHLDTPYEDGGWQRRGRRATEGGSFSGDATRRAISFILYLNQDWNAADGGALRIFPAHEFDYGMAQPRLAQHVEDVLPNGGADSIR